MTVEFPKSFKKGYCPSRLSRPNLLVKYRPAEGNFPRWEMLHSRKKFFEYSPDRGNRNTSKNAGYLIRKRRRCLSASLLKYQLRIKSNGSFNAVVKSSKLPAGSEFDSLQKQKHFPPFTGRNSSVINLTRRTSVKCVLRTEDLGSSQVRPVKTHPVRATLLNYHSNYFLVTAFSISHQHFLSLPPFEHGQQIHSSIRYVRFYPMLSF